jgi:hypothetical protein
MLLSLKAEKLDAPEKLNASNNQLLYHKKNHTKKPQE